MTPYKFNPHAGVIIIETTIKAKFSTSGNLILDTGASSLVLPKKFVQEAGLKIDPQKTIKTTTTSRIEYIPKVIIPEVTVLGKTIKNVTAIIKDLPPSAPALGLLGVSFLKHFVLTVDFKKGLLSLE